MTTLQTALSAVAGVTWRGAAPSAPAVGDAWSDGQLRVVLSIPGLEQAPGRLMSLDAAAVTAALVAVPSYSEATYTEDWQQFLGRRARVGTWTAPTSSRGGGATILSVPTMTSAAITASSAVLAAGELLLNGDTGDLLVGDGVTVLGALTVVGGHSFGRVAGNNAWSGTQDFSGATLVGAALPAATPVASAATSGTLTAGAEHNLSPASTASWTLPTGVAGSAWPTTVKNNGTATVTIARGGTDTINGGTASVSVAPGEWARFASNGTGAWTQTGTAGQAAVYATLDGVAATYATANDLRGTNTKAAIYYVDPAKGNDSYDGRLGWRRPFATIQAAINAANTATQAATIILSNDRHDVGSGLVIAKGQPVTITAMAKRPLKYASPASYTQVPGGCGPTLYSSTGAAALITYSGNGNAYGGSFQSLCFEMTAVAQINAIVARGVNSVTIDDCLFFFGTSTPADTSVAIWAYNLADASNGGDDSSWWRITNNIVSKGGLVKFGSSSSDTVAVQADANQNVIAGNFCTGRLVNPGDTVAPAIEINRGHRTSIRDNNIERYNAGILLRGCFQCAEGQDGGEHVDKFLRLVNTRSTILAPMGNSNTANVLVGLETNSKSNVIITAATTTIDSLYGTTTAAITSDSTSLLVDQTVIATDATGKPAARVFPKSAVRSNQWGYAPEVGPLATASLANGVQKYVPLGIDRAATIITIGVEVTSAGSAGSVIRLGVYADDGAGFPTGTPLLDAGTIDATSTGFKSITGLSLALPRGLYHLSAAGQGAPTTPPQVRCIGGIASGVVPLAGPVGGTNCTGYQDSASVTGALGTAAPNSNATGPLLAVRYQ